MPPSHRVHQLPGGARLVVEPMPERHSTSVVLMFAGTMLGGFGGWLARGRAER